MDESVKTNTGLVSVIIPTFNRAPYLTEAIDSVLNQTGNCELIVVDDGSEDDTTQVLAGYGSSIRVIRQQHLGVSAARNRGINEARGELISFLDSDDVWKPRKLEVQVDYLHKHSEVMICQTEEVWIRNGVRVNPAQKHKKYSGWIFEKMLPLCIVSPSAVMMRRELFAKVGTFDESLPVCEDYDFWLRVGVHYPITLINEPLIIKRGGHKDQLSRKYWGIDRFRIQSLQKLLDSNRLNIDQRKAVISELNKKCHILANGCLKRGKAEESRYFISIVEQYKSLR